MVAGIIFHDTAKSNKKTCPHLLCAYNNKMLCRPLSLHEANVLIPLIQDEMLLLKMMLSELDPDMADDITSEGLEADITMEEEILLTSEDIEEEVSQSDRFDSVRKKALELQKYGAFVRQIDPGIVDFYSIRAGQPVRLTWHFGEEEVSHWQPYDETGFYGHYPISDQDVFGRKVLH